MPTKKEDLPSTLKRSPEKVQNTYAETLDSAEETYDSEARAHRAAWSSVKRVAEKRGDHWELKDSKGPSDLFYKAKRAGVDGLSKLTKDEIARAFMRANDRATAKARG